MRLSVIMPAFNEVATLAAIVDRVLAVRLVGVEIELIIIDDGSNDGTDALLQELARRSRVRVLRQSRNRGKGTSIAWGLAEATGDLVLIQDADLEYDPADYGELLAPLLDGRADVVFGSRFTSPRTNQTLADRVHRVGNRWLTRVCNAWARSALTDMACCHKVLPRSLALQLDLRAAGFAIDAEIVVKTARLGTSVREVPVSYRRRTYAQGKKIRSRDVLPVLWTMVRWARWEPRWTTAATTLQGPYRR